LVQKVVGRNIYAIDYYIYTLKVSICTIIYITYFKNTSIYKMK